MYPRKITTVPKEFYITSRTKFSHSQSNQQMHEHRQAETEAWIQKAYETS